MDRNTQTYPLKSANIDPFTSIYISVSVSRWSTQSGTIGKVSMEGETLKLKNNVVRVEKWFKQSKKCQKFYVPNEPL